MAYRRQLSRQYTSEWLLSKTSKNVLQLKDFLLDKTHAHPTWCRLFPLFQQYVHSCEKEVGVYTFSVSSKYRWTATRKFRTMEEKLGWCWLYQSHHENHCVKNLPQSQLQRYVPPQVLVGLWARVSCKMAWKILGTGVRGGSEKARRRREIETRHPFFPFSNPATASSKSLVDGFFIWDELLP